jgi:hypothetical protein
MTAVPKTVSARERVTQLVEDGFAEAAPMDERERTGA